MAVSARDSGKQHHQLPVALASSAVVAAVTATVISRLSAVFQDHSFAVLCDSASLQYHPHNPPRGTHGDCTARTTVGPHNGRTRIIRPRRQHRCVDFLGVTGPTTHQECKARGYHFRHQFELCGTTSTSTSTGPGSTRQAAIPTTTDTGTRTHATRNDAGTRTHKHCNFLLIGRPYRCAARCCHFRFCRKGRLC